MIYSLGSQKLLDSHSLACLVSFQIVVLDNSSYHAPKLLLTEIKTSFITVSVGIALCSLPHLPMESLSKSQSLMLKGCCAFAF